MQAPTGLYERDLPSTDADSRSVTYSCSKPISPRPELLYSQIPDALLRGRNPVQTLSDRMMDMSDIVSSSAAGRPTILALSQPLFAPGDILEFDATKSETVVQQQSDFVVRHDLYLADLESIGLDSEPLMLEIKAIYTAQMDALAEAQKLLRDTQINIDATQRYINESNKVLNTIDKALKITSSSILISSRATVVAKLQAYTDTMAELLATMESTNTNINTISDNIRDLSTLVR